MLRLSGLRDPGGRYPLTLVVPTRGVSGVTEVTECQGALILEVPEVVTEDPIWTTSSATSATDTVTTPGIVAKEVVADIWMT